MKPAKWETSRDPKDRIAYATEMISEARDRVRDARRALSVVWGVYQSTEVLRDLDTRLGEVYRRFEDIDPEACGLDSIITAHLDRAEKSKRKKK